MPRWNVAAVDRSGNLLPWATPVVGALGASNVFALAATAGRVHVGGEFSRVGTEPLANYASLDP